MRSGRLRGQRPFGSLFRRKLESSVVHCFASAFAVHERSERQGVIAGICSTLLLQQDALCGGRVGIAFFAWMSLRLLARHSGGGALSTSSSDKGNVNNHSRHTFAIKPTGQKCDGRVRVVGRRHRARTNSSLGGERMVCAPALACGPSIVRRPGRLVCPRWLQAQRGDGGQTAAQVLAGHWRVGSAGECDEGQHLFLYDA